ncbi:PREDICTED: oxysterol-binding protein-related protein 11 [Nicrophorus vespilloides]|uniref:Oxysterol-binding protein-related protein 11 n=1 Tax=Nicrophorus vespilloides TaxID=110193 RepID=A0ABM1N1J5_NICVS|nr:PREDICTED: oxysterol-binding protein-related protein 11 [Nicrophorus vespilloides]XP_017780695.1 PREDICTED: oxysterol-binding protein-related protein 11 [Nicrophorus vespilloides]
MDLQTMKPRQFSGQLYKYTNVMKGWQYRYFMVDGSSGHLHYYLCEGEKPDGAIPRGSVHLAGAVICPSEEDSKTFTVNCASGDMLKLRASDARARQEWVNGLRAVAESHTKSISVNSTPLPPREHLAVLDAIGCAKAQLQRTELADTTLCRALESSSASFFTDPNLLLLKATSAASLHCLFQCLNILQRNQHQQQARTGFVIDDD